MGSSPHHSPRRLTRPKGWVLYASESQARRLVVFVHGFAGRAVRTWRKFPESGSIGAWWRESDLLFVGYDSIDENITGAAARLRNELPRFFPRPPDEVFAPAKSELRAGTVYEELVVVGHSLGGVVIRRALADTAQGWLDRLEVTPNAPKPALLDAKIRLFSPASAGVREVGIVGFLKLFPGRLGFDVLLGLSSAYVDIQPGSPYLESTQRLTEALYRSDPEAFRALRAWIVWANPDKLVLADRYRSDYVDEVMDKKVGHRGVCKPNAGYLAPWVFVETGSPR